MTNIISTTKGGSPKPDSTIESPIASKVQPRSVDASLESCINTRRAELVFKLTELRASMHLEAMEAGDKIKARLSELSHILRESVVDGWANIGDGAKHKLDGWLAASAQQLAALTTNGHS